MPTTSNRYETVGPDSLDIAAFGSFQMEDGTVVYDREADSAWIHSTVAVDLPDAC